MFAQLGNIVFDGLFGFNDLRFDGEEVNFAEFNLFGRKPTLQKTGTSLLEISTSITLNVDFCNISEKLKALQSYRNSSEVVALLMGSGLLIGNFVIVSMPFTVDSAFPDGTFQQITIDLTLREHVNYNIAQQQKQSAQKKAFAVGNKKPVVRKTPPPVNAERQILQDVTAIKQQSAKVNNAVLSMQAAPSQFNVNTIKALAVGGESLANSLLAKFDANPDLTIAHGQIKSASTKIKKDFANMYYLHPLFTLPEAISRNTALQSTTRQLSAAATPLSKKVTSRK
jgi:phage protein U